MPRHAKARLTRAATDSLLHQKLCLRNIIFLKHNLKKSKP